jgi:hypothetical protein
VGREGLGWEKPKGAGTVDESSGIISTRDMISWLKEASKTEELFRVTSYEGIRKGKEIKIDIWDGGEGHHPRYMVVPTQEGGRPASAGTNDDLRTAIAATHWYDLDKED